MPLCGTQCRLRRPKYCYLNLSCLILLIAAACGGATLGKAPRQAVQLPRGPRGPSDSPAIKGAFAVQGELDLPASQSTMLTHLGSRYAGTWIVNNGRRGVLYIGAVHLSGADRAYARGHIHMGRNATFSLVNERYSMTQLDGYDSMVSKYVEKHYKSKGRVEHLFLSLGVSPPDNAVKLVVSKTDAAFWIPRIQRLVPYDAFVVRYSSARAATAASRVSFPLHDRPGSSLMR